MGSGGRVYQFGGVSVSNVCVCVKHLHRCKTSSFVWDSHSDSIFLERSTFYITVNIAGGRSVMVSLLPTKTLTNDGDTRLGQSGVPAIFPSWWQGAKPSTPTTTIFHLLHRCRNLTSIPINDHGLRYIRTFSCLEHGRRKSFYQFMFTWLPTPSSPTNLRYLVFSGSSPTHRRWYYFWYYLHLMMSILVMENIRKCFAYSY